jgi:decaprenylphospho-beta-D-ribofuranose 2-oxidase
MGRSILQRGRFATGDQARSAGAVDPLRYTPKQLPSPPDLFPSGLLNRLTVRAFNELWYRKAPTVRRDELQTIEQFFHPLDMIAEWNRIYGPRGFLQWQFVVPDSAGEVVRTAVERLSGSGVSSFLAVLKRFGPGNEHYLSFPLDELDELVVEAGGAVYLAKDSRVRPELVPLMYPQLDRWREVRSRLDPEGRFRSDLARRLRLC